MSDFTAPAFLAPLINLAGLVAKALSLSDEHCADELFMKRHIFNAACLKGLVAKLLGWIMTCASVLYMVLNLMPSAWYITAPAIVKFPQIKNMLAAGSAAGLSAASVYTETFMYCCNVAYFVRKDLADNGIVDNFQEYGENVNLTLQNLIIIALMWRYSAPSIAHVGACLAAFAVFWAWAFALPETCSDSVTACFSGSDFAACSSARPCHAILMVLPMPLMLMARLPQIVENFRNGHTGILSLVTLTMNTLGSIARIFTTMADKQGTDTSALLIYCLSFALNGTMALQVIAYKTNTARVLAANKTSRAKKAA